MTQPSPPPRYDELGLAGTLRKKPVEVIQVRKDDYDLEGLQTHVAMSAFGFSDYLETIAVVDEDVDILDMAGGLVGCDNPL